MVFEVYAGDFWKGINPREDFVSSHETFDQAKKVAYEVALGWCQDEKPKLQLLTPGCESRRLWKYETDCDFGSIIKEVN